MHPLGICVLVTPEPLDPYLGIHLWKQFWGLGMGYPVRIFSLSGVHLSDNMTGVGYLAILWTALEKTHCASLNI